MIPNMSQKTENGDHVLKKKEFIRIRRHIYELEGKIFSFAPEKFNFQQMRVERNLTRINKKLQTGDNSRKS